MIKVGIVGCGFIGAKRAAAVDGDRVAAVYDIDAERARSLAAKYGAVACDSLAALLPQVDAVVVATTNAELTPAASAALDARKHVLVEKPAARSAAELEPLVAKAKAARTVAKVGFNLRFHPAARKARAILDAGECGPVLFVRARYGHGGRVGWDREWRANPAISGGGELLDQGVHIIDLARWYLGAELTEVFGRTATFFWKMPVDDNAFLTLATASGRVAHLHASCTEWKNLFSFEIYARDAKLHIEGLGGSYGVERLYHYQMRPEMGPPDTTIHEYPGADVSWRDEWRNFRDAIEHGSAVSGGLDDALATLRVVDRVYGR
jgi:predicted dehydrogenase